jgi:hypothetical protein
MGKATVWLQAAYNPVLDVTGRVGCVRCCP